MVRVGGGWVELSQSVPASAFSFISQRLYRYSLNCSLAVLLITNGDQIPL